MKKLLMFAIAAALVAGGCAKKNDSGKRARENYSAALSDSIRNLKGEIDSCNSRIAQLDEAVNVWLRDFSVVDNSREVEGYTIRSGWQGRYPLKSTGVVARITQSEGLELIAALSGGVFDRITVTSDGETASTAVVPNDQALNYRRAGLTTVMFTGAEADSVAHFISDNMLDNITVTFTDGGRATGTWKMGADYEKMIGDTWQLYSSHRRQQQLERRVLVLQEKVKLLREHAGMNEEKTDENQ